MPLGLDYRLSIRPRRRSLQVLGRSVIRQFVMPYLSSRFASRVEADLAVGVLSDNGIDSWVTASDAGGTVPSMQPIGGVRLEVAESDLERAEVILEETELGKPLPSAPLSVRERTQSWVVGIFLLLVLGWMLWGLSRGAPFAARQGPVDTPPQAELPF